MPQWALCSCVLTAKYILGRESETWGNARDIKPNSNSPVVGSLVILNEGYFGHIAILLNYSDKHITFEEGNWEFCKKTVRTLDISDPRILGYFMFGPGPFGSKQATKGQ